MRLRDKAYAHTDKDYKSVLNNDVFFFKEIESIYNVIDEIIKYIYGLFGCQMSTDLEFENGDIHLLTSAVDCDKWIINQYLMNR